MMINTIAKLIHFTAEDILYSIFGGEMNNKFTFALRGKMRK